MAIKLLKPAVAEAIGAERFEREIRVGTLTHTVVAEESVPDDLSGSQLPPVSTVSRPPVTGR